MSRLATSFVLAYHGCDARVADKAVSGDIDILKSEKAYDWLGPGAYFWESDPQRALEWAKEKAARGDYRKPAVIGAVVDLGHCLDLVARENLELVRGAFKAFKAEQKASGLQLPENKSIKGKRDDDRILRFLDCAVIRHLHSAIERVEEDKRIVQPFDTVRGMFTEGRRLYPGCGYREKTHVQIAVRNQACIKGIFYPRNSM
ncbi:hypothetical protein [Sphingomonas sp.]|uniref:hypothetical protein n=1 Tax=Sphingomonas sp. TaxID=28214 RepID=UPI0025E4F62E|nr:hypothetical protein [Sphingomonas sp.]